MSDNRRQQPGLTINRRTVEDEQSGVDTFANRRDDADSLLAPSVRPATGHSEVSGMNASSGQGSTDGLVAGRPQTTEIEQVVPDLAPPGNYDSLSVPQQHLIDSIRGLGITATGWTERNTRPLSMDQTELGITQLPFRNIIDYAANEDLTGFEQAVLGYVSHKYRNGSGGLKLNHIYLANEAQRSLIYLIRQWFHDNKPDSPSLLKRIRSLNFGRRGSGGSNSNSDGSPQSVRRRFF